MEERLRLLRSFVRQEQSPDLDIGIALFDLQSVLEGSSTQNPGYEREGEEYFKQSKRFYDSCKAGFPALAALCDRRLADAEGLHGSVLYLKKRYAQAVPFLRAVIDRPDTGVRREVLTAALKAYAMILISSGKYQDARPFAERAQRLEAGH